VRILITGGTGYLGRTVVRAFADRGHHVTVFARTASSSGLPGTLTDGDVRDRLGLDRAAAGCDAICHMAALVSIWRARSSDFDEVNIGGLRHVLDVAAARSVPRVLYASSFLALPPRDRSAPIEANDYARTKIAADRLADDRLRDGSPLIRVYPGVVYGPGSMTEGNLIGRLIADHLKGRLPGLVGPENRWSFSYVEDVAWGFVSALERGRIGGCYRLGGENAPQQCVFTIVEQITGRATPRRLPFPLATGIGAIEECRARLFGATPIITRGAVEIFRHDWSLDSSEAVRELGYTMTTLLDGITRTVAAIEALEP
jgi:farnesol dehydrogenase